MPDSPPLFAVIPAAGASRRMGQPKLTLPLDNRTTIEIVVSAFQTDSISEIVVVANATDEALCRAAASAGASVVRLPSPSPDMRFSVQAGLDWLHSQHTPAENAGWMLAPGDCVGLNRHVVTDIATRWYASEADVLVPLTNGRRGHPTCFRWHLVETLRQLHSSRGVNSLLKSDTVRVEEFPVSDAGTLSDMDTPDDYSRAKRMFAKDE